MKDNGAKSGKSVDGELRMENWKRNKTAKGKKKKKKDLTAGAEIRN